jgi:cytidylate kinase
MNTEKKIIIAVDGYSSTGKSSFAKALAVKLGYIYVDTGAMYRAVTLYGQRKKWVTETGEIAVEKLIQALPDIHITFQLVNGQNCTFLNDENIEKEIREIQVSQQVSRVSAIPEVREQLVHLQKLMGKNKGIVMDGRDIGTVVFPDAELKIFMTAEPKVRAERRFKELKLKGSEGSLEDIYKNVMQRDYEDTHRAVAPLRKASDAALLDNSYMTPEQQMEWFDKLLEENKTV